MSILIALVSCALVVLTAVGIHEMQGRLELWDYQRRSQD